MSEFKKMDHSHCIIRLDHYIKDVSKHIADYVTIRGVYINTSFEDVEKECDRLNNVNSGDDVEYVAAQAVKVFSTKE